MKLFPLGLLLCQLFPEDGGEQDGVRPGFLMNPGEFTSSLQIHFLMWEMKIHWRFTLGQITWGMSGIRSKARFSPQENRKHVEKRSKHVVIFPGILWQPLELLERCYRKEQNAANPPSSCFSNRNLGPPKGMIPLWERSRQNPDHSKDLSCWSEPRGGTKVIRGIELLSSGERG